MMNRNQVTENYKSRTVDYYNEAARLGRKATMVSFLRLFAFIGGIIFSIAAFNHGPVAGAGAVVISVSLFLYLVKLYGKYSNAADFSSKMSTINLNEALAMTGDWSSFDPGNEWVDISHDFSNDIDLFGKESLFQYLNRTFTGYGKSVLARWLSDPYGLAGMISERQKAIKELGELLVWRQEFIAHGMGKSLEKSDIESLLVWLKDDDFMFSSAAGKVMIFALPALTVTALVLVIAGLVHYPVFLFFFMLNLLLTGLALRKTNRIHELLSKKFEYLSSVYRLLTHFESQKFDSPVLSEIGARLAGGPASASERIKKLSGVIRSFDSRLNLFAGFLMNGLILWDFHCIEKLENWKKASASDLPGWLESCGEIEAFCSLAGFSYNNQDFAWPVPSGDDLIIESKQMGHPLLDRDLRICNDFSVPAPGRIVIITGANMAGKSTFLRTVAVNMILAMTGAPVCAGEMRFSTVKLFTSMRTTDSLSNSESYFYAELKRLKTLKDKLEGEKIFFILDEILKGTNSADKSTGSRLFLRKLAEVGAAGMIATHDTSLGEMEKEYPGIISNKCFEIDIDGDKISFDYLLRNGITTRMNAALLMKEMGITD
jgi:hypothetical protein